MNEFQRAFRWMVAATVVLYVLIAALAVTALLFWLQVNQAVCTFREDLSARADSSQQLLDDNPHEALIFAIPREVIANSVKNQKATVESLDGLHCF